MGFVELGEFTFDIPVRRGQPVMKSNMRDIQSSPVFSTAMGMLQLANQKTSPETTKRVSVASVSNRWESFKTKIGKTFSI